ncbi:MAG TPA: hypothetical protein VF131_25065 [Blastocatellia bacterium]|nr:hypothetical protein [Blastocatellia bacterium]
MSVLLVTYDLNAEKKKKDGYEGFYKVIKSYPWARLSESSYAIDTTDSVSTVYSKLRDHMDANDHVYIITLKKPYQGFGPKDVNDWLESRLPY